jgi:DNA polymerase-3 subunit alpha (Gram-positive type)
MTTACTTWARDRASFPLRLTVTLLPVLVLLGSVSAARTADPEGTRPLPFERRKLANVTFVAFDTETTGVNPKKDRIVELAAVRYRDGKILEEKTWLINPQRKIPYWAQRVHGISEKMVEDAPTFAEIYPEFLEFAGDAVLVAHNASFDITFLNKESARAQLAPPPNVVIDSLRLFRQWFPKLKSHSLSSVADHAKVSGGTFHRALADSMYIAQIFNKHAAQLDDDIRMRNVYDEAGKILVFDQSKK